MVFVDSNVFISIWDKDNINHKIAVIKSRDLEKIGESIVISNIIVYEVASVLAMRVSKLTSLDFLKNVEKSQIEVVLISDQLDKLAREIFKKIKDKNVSFFDCTSFAIVERHKIDKVFSFDKDFRKFGKNSGWQFV